MKKKESKKPLKFALSYFKKYRVALIIYVLTYAFLAFLGLKLSIETAHVLDQIATNETTKAIYTLFAVIGFSLLMNLVNYLLAIAYYIISNKVSLAIKADISKRVLRINSSTLDHVASGTIINRIDNDPENLIGSLDNLVYQISELVTFALKTIYIIVLSWIVGVAVVASIVIMVIVELIRVKVFRKNYEKNKKLSEPATSITAEIIRSQKDIKTLGLEEQIEKKFYDNYLTYKKSVQRTAVVNQSFWNGRGTLTDLLVNGVILLALVLLDQGLLGLAAVIYIFSNCGTMGYFANFFGYTAENLATFKVTAKRIHELYDDEKFAITEYGNKEVDTLKGNIKFKNVGFYYTEKKPIVKDEENNKKKRKKKNSEPEFEEIKYQIFKNLNFEIEPNTTVAFIGASGSGKSTIMNLIAKLNDPTSGKIYIDDHNLNDLSKNSIRNNMILINQFPYIYDMTIRENIQLAKKDATDEEILKALKDANLDKYVEKLPNGLSTKIGENGVKMSGGEKQRLAIARALIKNTPIIIFDESTSSLDNISQAEITKSIHKLSGKHTVIIVAHRLSTIKNADKIYFLDNGKIIDNGTFDELNARNEKFKTLFLAEMMEEELKDLKDNI